MRISEKFIDDRRRSANAINPEMIEVKLCLTFTFAAWLSIVKWQHFGHRTVENKLSQSEALEANALDAKKLSSQTKVDGSTRD